MLFEYLGEDLLDPFTALSRFALFTDDLSIRSEQLRDRLRVARVVRLGKRRNGESDRILVLRMPGLEADAAVAVSGLAGGPPDTVFCGPRKTAIATSARVIPAMVKILRMG